MSERRIANWSLSKIAKKAGGRIEQKRSETQSVTGVSIDSRSLNEGDLFFALKGDRFDGHDFIFDATDKGASAVVVSKSIDVEDAAVIRVDDTYAALRRLGHEIWTEADEAGAETINVTGSNGKTTVKEMLRCAWGIDKSVYATRGNFNNEIGLPLVLTRIPTSAELLVLELGANDFGEISDLIRMAPGEVRIITSIGRAHLDGFGDLDGVRRAKSEIFEAPREGMTGIVPTSEAASVIPTNSEADFIRIGDRAQSDIRVIDFEQSGDASRVILEYFGEPMELELPIPGYHQAMNLGTTLGTFHALSVAPPESHKLEEAFQRLELPGGRWRVREKSGMTFVDDAYNANPDSLIASFKAFRDYACSHAGDTVVVIGEMAELGEDAYELHRKSLAQLASIEHGLDGLAVVSERWGQQLAEYFESVSETEIEAEGFSSRRDVVDWLNSFETPTLFLKASREAQLEKIVEEV